MSTDMPPSEALPEGYVLTLDWCMAKWLAEYRQFEDKQLDQVLGVVREPVSDG